MRLIALSVLIFASSLHADDYLSPTETPLTKYLKEIDVTEYDSGVTHVDCIYVINIDYRTDKWNRLLPIFDSMDMKVNRMSAVIGKLLTSEQIQEMFGPYEVKLWGPEIGCLLSHLSIIKDAYDRGFNIIWACEDDIEFLEDVSIIPEFIENLTLIDPEWDILYTDTACRDPYEGTYYPLWVEPRPGQTLAPFEVLNKRTPVGYDLERLGLRYGTTSMIISRSGIEKILNYFSHVYLWRPIDWELHYIPGIREYGITRDAITNLRRGFPGDIHWIPPN